MLNSYEAFNVENVAGLLRDAAEEIGKLDSPENIIVGKIVVGADKISNLIKPTQKQFEASVDQAVRERIRVALEQELNMRIRNSVHLWEILRISSKHMNQIGNVSKPDRQRAQKICTCLSALFPS